MHSVVLKVLHSKCVKYAIFTKVYIFKIAFLSSSYFISTNTLLLQCLTMLIFDFSKQILTIKALAEVHSISLESWQKLLNS